MKAAVDMAVIDLVSMHESPRCGARTRAGGNCRAPAVKHSERCRMHGGKNSGPPKRNQNALKHGLYTAEMLESRKRVAQVLRDARKLLQ